MSVGSKAVAELRGMKEQGLRRVGRPQEIGMYRYVDRREHERHTTLARMLRVIRALAESSVVAIGLALAILLIGLPVVLTVGALGALVGWLADGIGNAIAQAPVSVVPLLSLLGAAMVVATTVVLFFRWRRRLVYGRRGLNVTPSRDQVPVGAVV